MTTDPVILTTRTDSVRWKTWVTTCRVTGLA